MKLNANQIPLLPAGQASGLIKQPMLIMLLLIAVPFIAAVAALFFIANQQNIHEDGHSRLLLIKTMENRQEIMRSRMADYADWGEAYKNLHLTMNTQWAWDSQNLGSSLYHSFSYEGVFVVSASGETRYSVLNGENKLQPLETWLGENPLPLIKRQLENTGQKTASLTLFIDGQLTLLSAALITPGSDQSVANDNTPPTLLVFAERLTPEKISHMALEYGVKSARLVTTSNPLPDNASNFLILPITAGNVVLTWQGDNPGNTLLTALLPVLILLMVISLMVAFTLMHNALSKARLNDESTFMLEQSKQALYNSECRFRDVAETTTDWIWEADAQLRFTWISERFPIITGYSIEEWIGRPVSEFLLNDSQVAYQLNGLCHSGGRISLTGCRYASAQQHQRYYNMIVKWAFFSVDKPGFRGTATDVTQEIEAQERVRYLSHFDELTGLPNRVQMKEFLEGKLTDTSTVRHKLAIVMIDLDKFKPVNDVYGHAFGDRVLHEASMRMRACLRESGMVTRHGGDEFIIILPDFGSPAQIEELCAQIIVEINRPFLINGCEIFIGASLRIALSPQDACVASDLLRFADIALYKAKNEGRNQWVFFNRDMNEKIVQRRELEQELREGIRAGQLRIVYQPRLDLHTSKITAVEALVRWQHPSLGLLVPDQFIPLAEETGLINALSDWVLHAACRDTLLSMPGLSVSVNISASELQDNRLYQRIKDVLKLTGLESTRLEIEVTENVTLKDPLKTQTAMQQIKTLGVKFLIDDFGTGFASLNYLRAFPFDGIKLDKSFIFPMNDSPRARQIVENMIGLGKAYSLGVTAEGVETQRQVEQLRLLQCDSLQGYFIGKPMNIDQLKKMIS
ncbi:bifunctional diguanylate cyclase/phosphodiesterase [Erwinia aphidicola]|uniref:bifunctional diguanylate cyclase/phosphodiesterase n=2 Tax=Erwinia aphidicola TaxID=68334 RepID=UPI0030D11CDA